MNPGSVVPGQLTLSVIRGRWRLAIIRCLASEGRLRFSEIVQRLDGMIGAVLAVQLRSLEREGIIHRTVYAKLTPHVEYALTSLGRTLEPVLQALTEWEANYASHRPEEMTDLP